MWNKGEKTVAAQDSILVRDNGTEILLRSHPGTRKIPLSGRVFESTFKSVHQIARDLLLLQVAGSGGRQYWTLMTKGGRIVELPKSVEHVLSRENWGFTQSCRMRIGRIRLLV